ncbi:MAG: GNAT family N-acetyltransferase [Candidatus Margulisbacteria bacterium]|nr:GNAT family N-acetyltransferase [Candidatus Margulisiibacteriota bacterium]
MSQKERYKQMCKTHSIPIFSQHWWLDAVCGHQHWDILLATKNDQYIASLPIYTKTKIRCHCIVMPPLTQTLGPHLFYPDNQSHSKKLSFEKEVFSALIKALPKFGYFSQNFQYSHTNWLPFCWNGFNQSTRYTYRLEDLSDLDQLYSRFQSKIKTDIQKAAKHLTIQESHDIDLFYSLIQKTFSRQKLSVPYSLTLLKQIDTACYNQNCRQLFLAVDSNGNCHAGTYLIWDSHSAYYLIGGGDPELRNSGATSLLVWKCIQFASKVTTSFDFEGSMLQPVERFFRGFGAQQTPYFEISKATSRLIQTGLFLKRVTS